MAVRLLLALFTIFAFAQLISAMPRPQFSDWTGSGTIMDAMGSSGGSSYSASNHFGFNSFPQFGGYWGRR